jgi:hypothetical protein
LEGIGSVATELHIDDGPDWPSEVIGSVVGELHTEDGPADDGEVSGVEVGPMSDDGEVGDPSETIVDGAGDSDHTDEGLPAAALVDSPWLLAGEAVSPTEV